VQVPGEEQPGVVGIDVRKTALGRHELVSVATALKLSRSHECERGTQECVRHETKCVRHETKRARYKRTRCVRHD
jgi:hypothetical protein